MTISVTTTAATAKPAALRHRLLGYLTIGVFAITGVLIGVSLLSGARFFVVETPSMGTYAPVGTLVVSMPATAKDLTAGQTITFVPPGNNKTYFHRIHDVTAQGIHTKGDLNGAVDPWLLTPANIQGHELLHVPFLGWLTRALPIFLIGGVAMWVFARARITPLMRFPFYLAGFNLLFTVANFCIQPWFRAVVISKTLLDHRATVQLVATGILPIQSSINNGTVHHAAPGEIMTITQQAGTGTKDFLINVGAHLGPTTVLLVATLTLLPTVLAAAYFLILRSIQRQRGILTA